MKGDTVFAGYWQLPQATEDSFSDGWFKTGDLGKATSAGYIYVVDRKKDMILCGGENVYCTEVSMAGHGSTLLLVCVCCRSLCLAFASWVREVCL